MDDLTVTQETHPLPVDASPSFREAFMVWLKIGCLSFGGPAAQIALMHREIVEQRAWLSESRFLNALNFCMLLPGPEAMQLATYTGWRLNGTLGGLLAGLLFVLPGALVMLAMAAIYISFGSSPIVTVIFQGIQATVVVIVISALRRLAKKSLQKTLHWLIAISAFVGIFFINIPYPIIVILAATVGWFLLKETSPPTEDLKTAPQAWQATVKTAAIWLAIWWLPIVILDRIVAHYTGYQVLSDIAWFFSQLAVVTFGGAYAVLAYMTQDVVAIKGWLTTTEMMSGLGLAETTPGPLILVTEFVGFLAAFREGGFYESSFLGGDFYQGNWSLGIAGAVVTLWVTFVPCFLWIFVGGPYIDWIAAQPALRGALSAITSAVVGVILSLSLWFALHVFFIEIRSINIGPINVWQPQWDSINIITIGLTLINAYLLLWRGWSIILVLCTSAVLAIGLWQGMMHLL